MVIVVVHPTGKEAKGAIRVETIYGEIRVDAAGATENDPVAPWTTRYGMGTCEFD